MSTRLFLSRWGWWLFLLAALTTAVFLRFYQIGDLPPGLYSDEAYNGLDALRVLDGETPLFFSSNNGREPAYIYLTAVSISLFGNTPLAVRLSAAVVGSLTVLPVFALAATWFGRRTGLLSAWLWAVTLWPIHLSRIGLRAILLLPLLALAFWLGTLAWRQQKAWLWVAAGVAYGLGFYTYLPIRFTPLLLVVLAVLIWWRGEAKRLWPGALWFGLSTAVVLTPWFLLWFQQPELIVGRSGQVSILNPAINGGNLPLALLENTGRALGMFLWQGDDILRHNPALRPVFDWLMIVPFLLGLLVLGRQWRRLTAVTTLLWVLVMLGPTILAEDTPHFLRAVGVLPAVLFIPAVGLNRLLPQSWQTLSAGVFARTAVVLLLLSGSLWLTGRDYLVYAHDEQTAYLFETAVRHMAEAVRVDVDQADHGRVVYFDHERYWLKYPALRFLLADVADNVTHIAPSEPVPWGASPDAGSALYLWPHDPLALAPTVTAVVGSPLVGAEWGPLARGDLEPTPYALYARYTADPAPQPTPPLAQFDSTFFLDTAVVSPTVTALTVTLRWSNPSPTPPPDVAVFVHLLDTRTGQLVAQNDQIPAAGLWPASWWSPQIAVQDVHTLTLPEPYDPAHHQLFIGLYPVGQPNNRLPLHDGSGDAFVWLGAP